LSESLIFGQIQKKFFDRESGGFPGDTHFGGSAFNLGYVGAGSVFYGFLHWLMVRARDESVDELFFLSRDGRILYEMAEILFPESEGWPRRQYVLSSRRAARVASIRSRGDISALVDSSIVAGKVGDLFAGKFGLDLGLVSLSELQSAGFQSPEDRIEPGRDRERVRILAMALAPTLLKQAERERELLTRYYRGCGIQAGKKCAVVDIGYAGTMQAAIALLTNTPSLGGYYYATFSSARPRLAKVGWMDGYVGELINPTHHQDPICKNGFLFETIFCCSGASFLAFCEDDAGRAVGRFDHSSHWPEVSAFSDEVHSGARSLAYDMKRVAGTRIDELSMNSATASRVLVDFIGAPGGRDAGIFEGLRFSDSFAGSKSRFIVPPRGQIRKAPASVTAAIWREGSEIFARRPDISGNAVKGSKLQSSTTVRSESYFPFRELEARLVSKTAPEHTHRKYERSRERFFLDSKNSFVRFYWNQVGKNLKP